jgi:hypothetical protein
MVALAVPPKDRTSRRARSDPARLLAVPLYLALTLVLTWPLVREFPRALPTVLEHTDALLQAYLVGWDWRALASHPLGVFDAPIFHPERRTLTYVDPLLGEAVLAAPAGALTGNLAFGYNVALVIGFVASAWAAYRLARWLGVSRAGSHLCGFWFCFSAYRLCNIVDLNLLHTQFLPLGTWFALRFARERRDRDLWGLALTLAVQAYFAWYYVFFLATIYATVLVHALVTRRLGWRDLVRPRVVLALVACVALLAPVLVPFVVERALVPEFHRTLYQSQLYAADPLDYARVPIFNTTRGAIGPLSGDLAYWPGLAACLFALVGLAAWWRDRRSRSTARSSFGTSEVGIALSIGIVGFVLSLGPFLRIAGHQTHIPLPFAFLFEHFAGFQAIRATGRFAVLVLIGTLILAGTGYEIVRRRVGERRTAILFATAFAITLVDSLAVPVPLVPFPDLRHPPEVYRWLSTEPPSGPVLELPCPPLEKDERVIDAARQLYQHVHRRPRLDGVSGFVPPSARALRLAAQEFPGEHALDLAERNDARLIVMHYGDLAPSVRDSIRTRAAATPRLRPLATFGDDVVYEIRPR